MKAFINRNNRIILVLAGIIVLGSVYYYLSNERGEAPRSTTNFVQIPNKIITVYKADITVPEKDQVMRSVDAFMNEYKLPRGDFQNTYTLSVERRLNDVLEVVTNPEQPKSDAHATLYLRKVNDIWSVDPSAGPKCTLEKFERNECDQAGSDMP